MSNQNFQISVNLLKIRKASVRNIIGKTGTPVKCLVIPLEGISTLVDAATGIFLNMAAFENNNLNYGQTHIVKASYPKEEADAMTEEEHRAIPILGNLKPMEKKQTPVTGTVAKAENVDDGADDLPF